MSKLLRAVLAYSFCIALSHHALSQELDTLKKTTERWIDVRSRLSEEKAKWELQKEMLSATIETLTSHRDTLQLSVEYLELESKTLTDKTSAAQEKIGRLEASNAELLSAIIGYEQRMQSLALWLPEPLKEELDPLLRKIPTEGETATPVPNRLQNVVAIATLIDEFNNDLTLTHTIKTLQNGDVIDVRVLYWGLSIAYASDQLGEKAWVITPAENAWLWQETPQSAAEIKQLFDVYDKAIDPVVVEVPVTLSSKGAGQ